MLQFVVVGRISITHNKLRSSITYLYGRDNLMKQIDYNFTIAKRHTICECMCVLITYGISRERSIAHRILYDRNCNVSKKWVYIIGSFGICFLKLMEMRIHRTRTAISWVYNFFRHYITFTQRFARKELCAAR